MATDYKPEASEVLLKWIRRRYGSIPKFCTAHELDRIQVQRAIRGEIQRITVDFALDIQDATDGEVHAELWATPDEVREARKRRRSNASRRIEPEFAAEAS